MFAKTSFLLRPDLWSKLERDQQAIRFTEPVLSYAATSLKNHLRQAATASEDTMDRPIQFLRGHSVLAWIHSIALFGQLEVLVAGARVLTWFASLNNKLDVERNPLLHRLQHLEILELWAIALVKIVAKFGRHLLDDPSAIYKLVPALCPKNSIIFRQFR